MGNISLASIKKHTEPLTAISNLRGKYFEIGGDRPLPNIYSYREVGKEEGDWIEGEGRIKEGEEEEFLDTGIGIPGEKYISLIGKDNYVLFDMEGREGFYQPLVEAVATIPEEKPERVLWCRSWGEYIILKVLGYPVIYFTVDHLDSIGKLISPSVLVAIEGEGISLNDICGITGEYYRGRYESFLEMVVYSNFNGKVFLKILEEGLGKGLMVRESKVTESGVIIEELDLEQGYWIGGKGKEGTRTQLCDFRMIPAELIAGPEGDEWRVTLIRPRRSIQEVTFKPSDVFISVEKFAAFALNHGCGIYVSDKPKKAQQLVHIRALYQYLSDKMDKISRIKREMNKVGYLLPFKSHLYSRWNLPVNELFRNNPTVSDLCPDLWIEDPRTFSPEIHDLLLKMFSTWGYDPTRTDDFSGYFQNIAAPTAYAWTLASFYAPFFRRDFQNFPILSIYGDPKSGKTYLFETLLAMFNIPLDGAKVSFSQGTTKAGFERIFNPLQSGFAIVDEMTSDNMSRNSRMAQEFEQLLKNSYDYNSRRKSKMNTDMDVITTRIECGCAVGGEVSLIDVALRSRAIRLPLRKQSDFPDDVKSIKPKEKIAPLLHGFHKQFLLDINELSWCRFKLKMQAADNYLRPFIQDDRERFCWSVPLAFASIFMTPQELKNNYLPLCLILIKDQESDRGTDHVTRAIEFFFESCERDKFHGIDMARGIVRFMPCTDIYEIKGEPILYIRFRQLVNEATVHAEKIKQPLIIRVAPNNRDYARNRDYFLPLKNTNTSRDFLDGHSYRADIIRLNKLEKDLQLRILEWVREFNLDAPLPDPIPSVS
jgi:hypothetical protein